MPRPSPVTAAQRLELIERYKAGSSIHLLARDYAASRKFISYTLAASGIEVRNCDDAMLLLSRHPVRHDAFSFAEESEEAAYWVGFLMADGCVSHQGATDKYGWYVIVQISECDRSHLESLRDFLGAKAELRTVIESRGRTRPAVRLTVCSKPLADDLGRYGVVPRKAKTTRIQILENDRHFWRGVIDGDGCLRFATRKNKKTGGYYERKRPVLSVSGSSLLMEQFVAFVRSIHETRVSVHASHGNWGVSLDGRAAIAVVKHLYDECQIALPRKLSLAREIITIPAVDNRRRYPATSIA